MNPVWQLSGIACHVSFSAKDPVHELNELPRERRTFSAPVIRGKCNGWRWRILHHRDRKNILIPAREMIISETMMFTVLETATLSGASKKTIEKALETGIMAATADTEVVRGIRARHLPFEAVVFFATLKSAGLTDLPVKHKLALWNKIRDIRSSRLGTVEFLPGISIDLARLASGAARKAKDYEAARSKYLVSDPEILGGTPVISGTRITVYAVLARLAAGETVEDLSEDYPGVSREAFGAAALYAKTHPLRGRPSGKPWRQLVDA